MYLHLLNDAQKTALLKLAYRLSVADGEDGSDELQVLDDLRGQMGVTEHPDMGDVLGALPTAVFDSPEARAIAMMELLVVTYVDGYLHEAESGLIGEIAEAFGIDQQQLNAMAEWAMDVLDLKRGGNAVIAAAGK
jgi:DnaJ-domain-containing protein 1